MEASAHVVLKEDGGEATQLVPWAAKAWHAAGANSYTLGIEMAGFTAARNLETQLARAARIVGFWCHRLQVPAVHRMDARGGIARHRDLGAFGGGRSDPGGFDFDAFVARVRREVERGGFRPSWGK